MFWCLDIRTSISLTTIAFRNLDHEWLAFPKSVWHVSTYTVIFFGPYGSPRNCCQLSRLVIIVPFFGQPLGTCHTTHEMCVKIAFTLFIICASYENSILGPKEWFSSSSSTVSLFRPNKVPMLLHPLSCAPPEASDQGVFYSRCEKVPGSEWTDVSMSRAGPISWEFSAFRMLAHDVHTSLCAATTLLVFLWDCPFSRW